MITRRRAVPRVLILLSAASLALACGGDGGDMTGPPAGAKVRDVELAVGEATSVTVDGRVLTLRLPSASSAREYRLTVQTSATGAADQVVPMRLAWSGGGSGSGSISASRRAGAGLGVRPDSRGLLLRQRIRESSRRRLVREGVRPAGRSAEDETGSGIQAASRLPTGSTPSQGDTLEFWFAAQEDFDTFCSTDSAETVTAVVEEVGQRAAIVQDTAAPEAGAVGSGGFSDSDFQEISATFDTLVVPTDSAYFGRPADIDNNERVYILFTPEVNNLDPENSDTQVGGFFVAQDLAESGDLEGEGTDASGTCPASNEAEVLYLRTPGANTTADEAKRNAFSVSAHELQHLLNAANRVIKNSGDFDDLETTWLNEGLSHLAEEVVGLAALGDPVRSNLTFSQTAGSDSQTFETYLVNDFFNGGLFMENSPRAPALVASDPQGEESLQMRGFAWMFVRWLADHRTEASAAVPPGSGEESLIRDLAQADGQELSTGIENVEGATGGSFPELLGNFGLMVAVDDTVSEAGGEQVLPTWNLRNMYRELAAASSTFADRFGEYPLMPVESGFTTDTADFEVKPGAGKHFIFSSSGSTPELQLDLTDQTGSGLSGGRITIIRGR